MHKKGTKLMNPEQAWFAKFNKLRDVRASNGYNVIIKVAFIVSCRFSLNPILGN